VRESSFQADSSATGCLQVCEGKGLCLQYPWRRLAKSEGTKPNDDDVLLTKVFVKRTILQAMVLFPISN